MTTPSMPRKSASNNMTAKPGAANNSASASSPRTGSQAGPRPTTGPRTGAAAARTQQARPAGQSGAAGRQQQLVRPAPKAKVRKARLLVSKVEPWSVLKMAFLLSVALGIITVVAAVMLWTVLDITGVFDKLNELITGVLGTESKFDLKRVLSLGQVASFATIIAVANVVILTVIAMLGSLLYNISSSLVGGIGVTLTDD
ncbi:DUF3566 domain-containing protein [Neomicrococcus lactis]|uniref:DUF3566 domain-containing protein n=1 Tax=Neomicrococcus lactis TaxID=732241 RepID=A0A7W8YC57_9MICC|nr:DUF3566 domain-containing protein [Neomicrococcus lactis]MBB5598860.1 hypothetical protein [Neomicrococcus lactis]